MVVSLYLLLDYETMLEVSLYLLSDYENVSSIQLCIFIANVSTMVAGVFLSVYSLGPKCATTNDSLPVAIRWRL